MIDHLWQGEGYNCIAYRNTEGRICHKWLEAQDAVGFAQWCNRKGMDAWYAVANFSDKRRVKKNVTTVNALFVDLDCGPEKEYLTQEDALYALNKFCKTVGFWRPTIVNSGNGIHAYWMTDPTPVDQWQPIASSLKVLCKEHGLMIDNSRTGDPSSLMRLPGAANLKDLGLPKIIHVLAECAKIGTPPIPIVATPKAKTKAKKKAVSNFDIATDYPDKHYESGAIASKCAQMQQVHSSKGNVTEPLWHSALQILRFCDDGDTAAQEWSSGHSDYSPDDVEGKLERFREGEIGPSLCKSLDELNPGVCDGCPLKDTISTPLQLGVTMGEAIPEVAERVANTAQIQLSRWNVGQDGVAFVPKDDPPVQILNVPMYIERIGRVDGETVAAITWKTRAGNWRAADMPLSTLSEPRGIRAWLLNQSIVGTWTDKEKFVAMYLSDYIQKMQETADPVTVASQFGWQGSTEFLLGSMKLSTSAGPEPVRLSDSMPISVTEGLVPSGDPAEWRRAAELLNQPGYEAQAFTLLAGLAAPLMNIIEVPGAVLSLAGASGTGKSTVCKLALSVYGNPASLMLSPDSTFVAKNAMMRTANNLPVGIDDLSGKHSKDLGGLMYMAANGKAKERGDVNGNLRKMDAWQTVLLISTNNPVLDLPEKFLVEAERRRVLELHTTTPLDRDTAVSINKILRSNSGTLGPQFIQAIVNNREKIRKFTDALVTKFSADPNIPDQNRFGVWLCSAAYAAGKICADKDLLTLDYDRIVECALTSLRETTRKIMDPVDHVDMMIGEYLNKHANQVTRKYKSPGQSRSEWKSIDIRGNSVAACIIEGSEQLVLPYKYFREWLWENGVASTEVDAWVKAKGITPVYETLLPVKSGGSTMRCYRLNNYITTDEE